MMQSPSKTWQRWALALSLGLAGNACNNNVFEAVDKGNPAEKASAYLDQGKSDEAISVLNNALQDEPENWQLVSLLASAKAQKAGLDTLDIAIRLAGGDDEESDSGDAGAAGSDNALTSLFVILPEVTTTNRGLMSECVSLLSDIPVASRTNSDNFKTTLFNAAYTAMQAKFLDGDGDGKFTVEELANLDDETAEQIINSLTTAENAASYYQSETGASDAEAAAKVGEINALIQAQEGNTTAEKIRNYLGNGQGT